MNQPRRHERARPDATRRSGTTASRLAASWRRSEYYGVSPHAIDPVFVGGIDDGSVLFLSAGCVLRDIGETLADEPVGVLVTDAEGVVLARLCGNGALLRALDDMHWAPGFNCSEREVGTSGLGLTLADRAPSLVSAEQHYCLGLADYTGAAAPIDDPLTGEPAGSVSLTTWSGRPHTFLMALAVSAARGIEAQMSARLRGRLRPDRTSGAAQIANVAIASGDGYTPVFEHVPPQPYLIGDVK